MRPVQQARRTGRRIHRLPGFRYLCLRNPANVPRMTASMEFWEG